MQASPVTMQASPVFTPPSAGLGAKIAPRSPGVQQRTPRRLPDTKCQSLGSGSAAAPAPATPAAHGSAPSPATPAGRRVAWAEPTPAAAAKPDAAAPAPAARVGRSKQHGRSKREGKPGGAVRLSRGDRNRRQVESVFGAIRQQLRSRRSLYGHRLTDAQAAFTLIDADGSGALDIYEFRAALKRMGLGLTDQQVEVVLEAVDTDGNGTVEFSEFIALLGSEFEPEGGRQVAATTTKQTPVRTRLRPRRPIAMPVLQAVSTPRAPGPRHSGLDTSASKTWPWLPGANISWSELEITIIANIAAHLSPQDVVRAAGVCAPWRRVILRRCRIDAAWADAFEEKFGALPADCVGTSAARSLFLQKEAALRVAIRSRRLTMQLHTVVVGGWLYSVACGGGFVLTGSLCGAAAIVDARTGKLCKRLDGHRLPAPGKVGTEVKRTEGPTAHHEQFYCCAVATARGGAKGAQVVLGSNHALRFIRLPASEPGAEDTTDDGALQEDEEEEEEEAQLSYEQFQWLVRRQCRIDINALPDTACRQLFDFVDKDRSGAISGSEFAAFLTQENMATFSVFETAMAYVHGTLEAGTHSLETAFAEIDNDGSGSLDAAELGEALKLLGLKLSEAEVMVVLAGLDKDGSGEISYEEFSAGLRVAKRRSSQRAKIKEMKSKQGGGPSKVLRAEHQKTQDLIATAFLRLYERLERPPLPDDTAAGKKSDTRNTTMRAFRDLDEDESGTLNARELRAAFAQLGVALKRPVMDEVMAELDSDGSGSVDLSELLDRAFVARLEAVRRRLISSAVLQSSNEDEWGALFDRYARGQQTTMPGPTPPDKIESMTLDSAPQSSVPSAHRAPSVVHTSQEYGWVTCLTMVGYSGSRGNQQWEPAEAVAVGYKDGTVQLWDMASHRHLWTAPQAHGSDEHGGQGVIGVAAIGAGDPQLERLVLGEPPIVGNALVASVGRLGGIQLRHSVAKGEVLRVIGHTSSEGSIPSPAIETTVACGFRQYIVCGGGDGRLRLWNGSGKLVCTLSCAQPSDDLDEGEGDGRCVCVDANADRIAAVDAAGTLRVWEPFCKGRTGVNPDQFPAFAAAVNEVMAEAVVTPQFTVARGEQGWLSHPIWSVSWEGPAQLWCGLESGQLARLDFSEEGTAAAPLVFRPKPKVKPQDCRVSKRAERLAEQARRFERLARPHPRHAKPSKIREKMQKDAKDAGRALQHAFARTAN